MSVPSYCPINLKWLIDQPTVFDTGLWEFNSGFYSEIDTPDMDVHGSPLAYRVPAQDSSVFNPGDYMDFGSGMNTLGFTEYDFISFKAIFGGTAISRGIITGDFASDLITPTAIMFVNNGLYVYLSIKASKATGLYSLVVEVAHLGTVYSNEIDLQEIVDDVTTTFEHTIEIRNQLSAGTVLNVFLDGYAIISVDSETTGPRSFDFGSTAFYKGDYAGGDPESCVLQTFWREITIVGRGIEFPNDCLPTVSAVLPDSIAKISHAGTYFLTGSAAMAAALHNELKDSA